MLSPWLGGAKLTALHKKGNCGFRPIAVGDTFRRLASRLCCSAVRSTASEVLLRYNQLGVGVRGGREASIHLSRLKIDLNKNDEDGEAGFLECL